MHLPLALRLFPLLLSLAPVSAQEAQPTAEQSSAADSHAEVADALVELLQRTATTLERCTDEASVPAALPPLRALREEAAQLIARQAAMPEPTVQDYMAAQARANDFLDAKRAVQTQISRLQAEGLLTDNIRQILGIAPETPATKE